MAVGQIGFQTSRAFFRLPELCNNVVVVVFVKIMS